MTRYIALVLLAVGAATVTAQTDKIEVSWIVVAALAKELVNHGADAENVKEAVRGYVFDAMQENREWYDDVDWRESGTLLRVFEGTFNIFAERGSTSRVRQPRIQQRPAVPPAMTNDEAAANRRRLTGN